MKIALFLKSQSNDLARIFFDLYDQFVARNQVMLKVYKPFMDFLNQEWKLQPVAETFSAPDEISDVDFFITLGGDGTFLEGVTFVRNKEIPMAGINTGRLGFLADITPNEIEKAVNGILNNNFTVEKRTLLQVETKENIFGDFNYALNELTIHKKDSSSLITINADINNQYMNSYWADGLIISTPTGSTAYSLSAGGPIVTPDSKTFIINPIASHNLTVRPLVVSDDIEIRLTISGRSKENLISLDSRSGFLNAGEEVTIRKAGFYIHIIKLEDHNYFRTLRSKLMWGADVRN